MFNEKKQLSDIDFKYLLSKLNTEQKKYLYDHIIQSNSENSKQPTNSKRIVAFVTQPNIGEHLDRLKSGLIDRLPSYAIPQHIYRLESLPLLANGKVDKQQLQTLAQQRLAQELESSDDKPLLDLTSTAASLSDSESKVLNSLSAIWSEVLGIKIKSANDNFFDLGGDSILSIHVVSRMLRHGYQIGPNDIFDSPTLLELSKVIAAKTEQSHASHSLEKCDEAPLTPIQNWFFNTVKTRPGQWNLAKCYQLPSSINIDTLHKAINQLLSKHDVFRMCFVDTKQGIVQKLQPTATLTLETVKLPNYELWENALSKALKQIQTEFDLNQAPLARFILFTSEDIKILFITAHHLIIDLVSWQIIKQDLITQLTDNPDQATHIQPVSFSGWSNYINELSDDPRIRQQQDFWRAQIDKHGPQTPFELETGVDATSHEKNIKTINQTLGYHLSQSLVTEINQTYQTRIVDILLSALVLSVPDNFSQTQLTLDLESHGRFDPNNHYDLSQTIGWFSSVYPVCLSCNQGDADIKQRIVKTIKATKETLHQIDHGGLGFELLRQAQLPPEFDASAPRRLLFNYLGKLDSIDSSRKPADGINELNVTIPGQRHPENERSHYLEIQAYLTNGELTIQWHYDPNFIDENRLISFTDSYVQTLHRIVDITKDQADTIYTPSDFPDSGLDQGQLDDFLDSI